MNLRKELERRLIEAMAQAGAPADALAMVGPSGKPELGDYQANGVMAAAKRMKINPRTLATDVLAKADVGDLVESLEIAGPGFINIRLKDELLQSQAREMLADARLNVDKPSQAQNVVVDYSSPNLAKEMHVGHLRSTIIGDALARTLEFQGHNVIRQNHVGDYGTQFGMLTAYLDELSAGGSGGLSEKLSDLEDFYRQAKARFDSDADFADKARQYVVRLQSGQPDVVAQWTQFVKVSMEHCNEVYLRLNISLRDEHVRGESAYGDDLAGVVEDLRKAGLVQESQGAQCVFLPEFTGKDGTPLPLIVQKSDEGYLYATTDLAAMRYRANVLKAQRILYLADARQSLHFRQVFAAARLAGFFSTDVSLEHIGFGTMMGSDGKPFKTRSGGTIKLIDLLDEATDKAFALVSEKNPELPEDQRRSIAQAVGIGAVKYADLAQNRNSDYVFSFEKMLSLEGNTAPYMQYAYARIRSIFRKGAQEHGVSPEALLVNAPAERALVLKTLQFSEAISAVGAECMPNVLCSYLYDLAGAFMSFYESCPVLQSAEPQRTSRLALCELTAKTIQTGLGLLGIETIEQM